MVKSLSALVLAVMLIAACQTPDGTVETPANTSGETVFTMQLLHFADIDGNEERALQAVENFSALIHAFRNDNMYGDSTLIVSSGDNIIPGPRFYAAEQSAVRSVTGSNEPGHADVAFLNAMGVQASAMGNHDLDAGPGELADALSAESGGGAEFSGASFPYLSVNLDFSTEGDFEGMLGTDGNTVEELAAKVAGYAVARVNGETVGIIGASTPLLDTITSTGGITVKPSSGDVSELAEIIQSAADSLKGMGVNKIILLAHMQQISVEKELAGMLEGVDVIVAGGSNTRLGDNTDTLFPGDDGFDDTYPLLTKDAGGDPVAIVNVDGDYKYLGRLVVGFDDMGVINTDSLDPQLNGAWASSDDNVSMLGGDPIPELLAVRDAVQSVITSQFGNVLGYTDVYLDGRRSQVRTQETNLGNLSADANLWYANQLSEDRVHVSLKNGGGIRTEIGAAVVPPGTVDYSQATLTAPPANETTGTAEGAVTEGHLRATLRFDNGLVTLKVTAAELKMLLEHGVSATGPGATPGQFPQIGGMTMAFDPELEPGSRITEVSVLNEDGGVLDNVVQNGEIQGDESRTFRLVTLNFLANGGDSYPFDGLSDPQRINLYEGMGFGEETDYPDAELGNDPGSNSSFSYTGGEQDALAEYLLAFHSRPSDAYSQAETDRADDMRMIY